MGSVAPPVSVRRAARYAGCALAELVITPLDAFCRSRAQAHADRLWPGEDAVPWWVEEALENKESAR